MSMASKAVECIWRYFISLSFSAFSVLFLSVVSSPEERVPTTRPPSRSMVLYQSMMRSSPLFVRIGFS